jgi:hypothetical protein
MPLYEFFCDKCRKEVSLTLTISEREKGRRSMPAMRQPRATPAGRHVLRQDVAKVLSE